MSNFTIYKTVSERTSKMITEKYSTSFSLSCRLFSPEIRQHIYNIYGFVRFADEIVDTFHGYDKEVLLNNFERDYSEAFQYGISLNPVIYAFCDTVKQNNISQDLVEAFLHSMRMDLGEIKNLDDIKYREYIFGSSEVVGLMCLKVFVQGNEEQYEKLKPYAQSLGAGFQKINFLRDINADFEDLNRTYFPNVDFKNFTEKHKLEIEQDIAKDFNHALIGIRQLPVSSKIAVFLAYKYYLNLLKRIKNCEPKYLMENRISVSRARKVYLLGEIIIAKNLNLL